MSAWTVAAVVASCGAADRSVEPARADGGDVDAGLAAAKPISLPTFDSLDLYSRESPFNVRLAPDAELDPASETLVQGLVRAEPLVIQVRQYSAPVYFADASSPRQDVELPCGVAWELGVSRLLEVPLPPWAEPGFDADGAIEPTGCGEGSDRDDNLIVIDLEARCEHDFWQMRRAGGRWTASWGNAISIDSDGVYPAGISSRGSGFAFAGGLIWPDELRSGHIGHALAVAYGRTRSGGPVAPATDSDGETDAPDAIPLGARVRLDPTLDVDAIALQPFERTIAVAMQEYGMWMVDTGGEHGIGLYAVDPRSVASDPYAGALPAEDFVALPGIPIDRLEVLRLGPQDAAYRDRLAVTPTGCNRFE